MAEFIHSDPKTVQSKEGLFFIYKYFLNHGANILFPITCPEHGAFTGYKIGYTLNDYISLTPCLITLYIPEDAKRSSAYSNKCRCDKARVLDIRTLNGEKRAAAISQYDPDFIYEIDKEVTVPNFDENRWYECAPGIHFFMSEKEALVYWD